MLHQNSHWRELVCEKYALKEASQYDYLCIENREQVPVVIYRIDEFKFHQREDESENTSIIISSNI